MKNQATIHWTRIIHYIKSDECKDLHKFYSERDGWLYLSDWRGNRYLIKDTDSFDLLLNEIEHIRRINRNRLEV